MKNKKKKYWNEDTKEILSSDSREMDFDL